MNSFEKSWTALRASFRVLAAHQTLLLLPVISGAATLAAGAFFLVPWLVLMHGDLAPVFMACAYLAAMFLATYFNVAFYHAALKALRGEDASVSESLAFASSKLPAILAWSLFAGLVGLIIKGLEKRAGFLSRLVIDLIGATWSVAATFAVPAIVVSEEASPLALLRTSAETIKRTWGEDLLGFMGFAGLNTAIVLGSVAWLAGSGALAFYLGSTALFFASLAVWFAASALSLYVINVASQVYRGAMFIYATDGAVPTGYTKEQIHSSWSTRA